MFIPCEIQTKPRPRATKIGNFVRVYTPKTALTYERYIASEYQRLKGVYYGDQAIEVIMIFHFKAPKTLQKYGDFIEMLSCTKHKDLDNLAKSILDALNTVAYADDKNIIYLQLNKAWTNKQEGVEIEIRPTTQYLQEKEFKEQWKNLKKKH